MAARLVDAAFVWTEDYRTFVALCYDYCFHLPQATFIQLPWIFQYLQRSCKNQEHAMRIRVKITVQNEATAPIWLNWYSSGSFFSLSLRQARNLAQVAQSCVLQQTMVVEFQIVNQQCEDCQKLGSWNWKNIWYCSDYLHRKDFVLICCPFLAELLWVGWLRTAGWDGSGLSHHTPTMPLSRWGRRCHTEGGVRKWMDMRNYLVKIKSIGKHESC